MRIKTKRHNHRIGRHHKLTACDRHRTTTALRIGLTQRGAQQANAVDLTRLVQHQFDGLDVKLKVRALFFGIFDLFFRARHVGLIPTIGTGDFCRVMAQRGAHAVHRRIAPAQHHHV
ncbi:hypothetical protein D3C85_1251190 [compost metagenome]